MKHKPKTIIVDWLNTIWETDLPYQSKYLACYLRKFMNSQHDMAWPSYSRMIAETGLSRMTISRYLEILDSEGWLVRNRGRKGKNTEYTACFPSSITEVLPVVSERDYVVSEGYSGSIREVHELNKVINNKRGAHTKFAMSEDWVPDGSWSGHCLRSGVSPVYSDIELNEFITYWSSEQKVFTESQWQLKLINQLRRASKAAPQNNKNYGDDEVML